MSGNVISLNGGPTGEPQVAESCVIVLRELLARAEAGDITGVCAAVVHCDGLASYHIGGFVGGYSAIGALELLKAELIETNRCNE
jgi:hypothetical protein